MTIKIDGLIRGRIEDIYVKTNNNGGKRCLGIHYTAGGINVD